MITKAFSHTFGMDFTCIGCGHRFEENRACIVVLPDDKTELKDSYGDLCPGCVLNGPDALNETFSIWATLEDLAKAELESEAYYLYSNDGNIPAEILQGYIEENFLERLGGLQRVAEAMKDNRPPVFLKKDQGD